jgi:hypothetical protein
MMSSSGKLSRETTRAGLLFLPERLSAWEVPLAAGDMAE